MATQQESLQIDQILCFNITIIVLTGAGFTNVYPSIFAIYSIFLYANI